MQSTDFKNHFWAYEEQEGGINQTITRWGKARNRPVNAGFMNAATLSSSKSLHKTRSKILTMADKKMSDSMDRIGSYLVSQTGRIYPENAEKIITRSFKPVLKWQYSPPENIAQRQAVKDVFLKRNYYTIKSGILCKLNNVISDTHSQGMSFYSQQGTRWEEDLSDVIPEFIDFYAYELSVGNGGSIEHKLQPDLCYDKFSQGIVHHEDGLNAFMFWVFVQKRLADVNLEGALELFLVNGKGTDVFSWYDIEHSKVGVFSTILDQYNTPLDDLGLIKEIKRTKISYVHKPIVLTSSDQGAVTYF